MRPGPTAPLRGPARRGGRPVRSPPACCRRSPPGRAAAGTRAAPARTTAIPTAHAPSRREPATGRLRGRARTSAPAAGSSLRRAPRRCSASRRAVGRRRSGHRSRTGGCAGRPRGGRGQHRWRPRAVLHRRAPRRAACPGTGTRPAAAERGPSRNAPRGRGADGAAGRTRARAAAHAACRPPVAPRLRSRSTRRAREATAW